MLRSMSEHYAAQVREIAIRQALEDAKREAEAARATYATDESMLAA